MAVGDPYSLRITLRCLEEDLGMSRADVSILLTEIENEVVQAFVDKRRDHPKGNEPFVLPKDGPIADKLRRTERWRGATLYDSEENVVWLLGFGFHTSGRPDDVYEVLEALDRDDRLLPTSEDYDLLLDAREADLPELLRENAEEMLRHVPIQALKCAVLSVGLSRYSRAGERNDRNLAGDLLSVASWRSGPASGMGAIHPGGVLPGKEA